MPFDKDHIDLLPDQPGVYLMKDAQGKVVYVGKAVDVRKRIRSHVLKPGAAVNLAVTVEYVLTNSETEALLLENNLIKKLKPRYNVMLRDDKKFPFIKMTWKEDYPQIFLTRTRAKDGSRYFGPYPNVKPARQTLRAIKEIFPIRTCEIDSKDLRLDRPCIQYDMGRCVAPCVGKVSREEYRDLCESVGDFLTGKHQKVIRDLEARMLKCSEEMRYEQAAYYRDMAEGARSMSEGKRLSETPGEENEDFLGFARVGDVTCVVIVKRAAGKVRSSEYYYLDESGVTPEEEVINAFIKQYYTPAETWPREICTPVPIEDEALLSELYSGKAGRKVEIHHVLRGPKRRLIEMAQTNARFRAEEHYVKRHGIPGRMEESVIQLGQILGIDRLPVRIEGYDISNIHGDSAVGSMVVFVNGKPFQSGYRRFKIKAVEGIDDYAMMAELINRRLNHLPDYAQASPGEDEPKDIGAKPDLILIDGGQGHFNTVQELFRERGVVDIELASIAKQEELVFTETRTLPIRLREETPALRLLQNIRDEAHRFAITYHRNVRGKKMTHSTLDSIEGIGKRRRAVLLKRFGSVEGIRMAAREDLLTLPGFNEALADRILSALQEMVGNEEQTP